jgi:TfoX/Sxy family transcriptional regulator of competence genes
MAFPKSDPSSQEFLEAILPLEPGVQSKPIFGNMAYFVNGHMFAATFGSDIIVRLPEAQRTELLAEQGTAPFKPTKKGRMTSEYVVLPRVWRDTPEKARPWVARALVWVSQMPPTPKREAARRKSAPHKTRRPRHSRKN